MHKYANQESTWEGSGKRERLREKRRVRGREVINDRE